MRKHTTLLTRRPQKPTCTQDPTNNSCLSQVVTWIRGDTSFRGDTFVFHKPVLIQLKTLNSSSTHLGCWSRRRWTACHRPCQGTGREKRPLVTERRWCFCHLYPRGSLHHVSRGAGSEGDCEKMSQPLTAALADSAEASILSQPLKPEYIYSTTLQERLAC